MTADMCTPIFPNTIHPLGRRPLVPEPLGSFPYTNCYHWPDMQIDLRVLARPEGFAREKAVKLPAEESLRLSMCLAEDKSKHFSAIKARHLSKVGGADVPCSSGDHPSNVRDRVLEVLENNDTHSTRTSSSDYSASWSGSAESDNMMDGFFGDPTQNLEILPLVHLWVDMAATLKQDEIADPRDMYEERDAIVRSVTSQWLSPTSVTDIYVVSS